MAKKKRGEAPEAPPVMADITTIASWRDADAALGVLRRDDAEIARINSHYDQAIQILQQNKAAELAPLQERDTRVELLVKDWVTAHREELGGQTRRLVNGKVGYRKGAAKVSWSGKGAHVVAVLKMRGHHACIVIVESIDKKAVKNLPTSELQACGIRMTATESFFVELATDPVVELPSSS